MTCSPWKRFLVPAAVAAVVLAGALLFPQQYYAWISMAAAVIACLPLLVRFERRSPAAGELTVLAVLVAISSAGRFAFAWIPAFKPVTAVTVLSAMYLGPESGFIVGALSALVSNFYFGQGPWTPFQMFAWGFLGFLAGLLSRPLQKSKAWLCLYGIWAGLLYSLIMDVWTTLWADGTFVLGRYLAACASALPFTVMYAASNVVFLLILGGPVGEKLQRIKEKYGLFQNQA